VRAGVGTGQWYQGARHGFLAEVEIVGIRLESGKGSARHVEKARHVDRSTRRAISTRRLYTEPDDPCRSRFPLKGVFLLEPFPFGDSLLMKLLAYEVTCIGSFLHKEGFLSFFVGGFLLGFFLEAI